MLIELLADAWGVAPRGEGKSIWYEVYEASAPEDGPEDGGRGGPVDGSAVV